MTTDIAHDSAHYVFRHRCPCGERFAVRVPPVPAGHLKG